MSVSTQGEGIKTVPQQVLASLFLPPLSPSHFSNGVRWPVINEYLDN